MTAPSIDICWRIAEAEAALAGFSVIGPAHFWIGVCKAVDLELSALLDAATPEWKVAESYCPRLCRWPRQRRELRRAEHTTGGLTSWRALIFHDFLEIREGE